MTDFANILQIIPTGESENLLAGLQERDLNATSS
jgi:hypothetical protein